MYRVIFTDRPAPEVPTPASTPSPPGSGGLFGGMGLEEGGTSSGRGGGGGAGQQERPDPFGGMLSEGPSGKGRTRKSSTLLSSR